MYIYSKLDKNTKPLIIGVILVSLFTITLLLKNNSSVFQKRIFNNQDGNTLIFADAKTNPRLDLSESIFIENNSLKASLPPVVINPQVLGVLTGNSGLSTETERKEIIEYTVEPGDNLSSIAQKFNISLNTVRWANNLNTSSIIHPGQKLIILPVSGVIHYVGKGDTISEIAKTYNGKTKEIIAFNNLSSEGDIYVGDVIIIPNGVVSSVSSSQTKTWSPIPKNYFICPIALPCYITQGLHWYNAIDFSHGRCGEPIYAAAGGTVIKAKYHYIAGNYVRILHPNGVATQYGHLSKILVSVGQRVSQGQIIGLMGYTGKTIPSGPAGCHLHFDVLNVPRGTNPFAM